MKKLELGTKKCLQCGKIIQFKVKRDLWRKKFCCRQCSSKYNDCLKGIWNNIEMAERIKKNMRKPHRITKKLLEAAKKRGIKRKGKRTRSKRIVCQYCGKRFYISQCRIDGRIGKNKQKQLRKYCSNKCRTLATRKPDELKRNGARLKKWRSDILKRDNYKCVICEEDNIDLLQAAHKKSREEYPELQYDLNNGKTLCLKCHADNSLKYLKNLILSSNCRNKNKVYLYCLNCNKKYYRKPSHQGKFCSFSCYIDYKKRKSEKLL